MTTALFTKTHERDYRWLELLAKTVDKFAVGFDKWYIVLGSDNKPNINLSNIEVVYSVEPNPAHIKESPCLWSKEGSPVDGVGYNFQQVVKAQWYKYTDESTDAVLQLDSDCVITDMIYPHTVGINGRPLWIKRDWCKELYAIWGDPLEQFLGHKSSHEYMFNNVFLLTLEATKGFNEFISSKHSVSTEEYFMTHVTTEYNFFGAYLDNICMHNYYMIENIPIWIPISKYWSWGDDSYVEAKESVDQLCPK